VIESMSLFVQVFGCRDDDLSTPSDGRRPKSAKAGNRGVSAPTVQWVLWGFGVGVSVGEVEPMLAIGSL
jgi:hypothetical protein